ncbi:MAG: type IX secretion system membrane protein PorP/SprF, partial [Bacteroidota bacterium]
APSIKAGIVYQLLDDTYNYPPPIPPAIQTAREGVRFFDFSPGILVNTKKMYVGMSLEHAYRRPVYTFGQWTTSFNLPRRWNFHAGYTFKPEGNTFWSVSASAWAMVQVHAYHIQGGAVARFGRGLVGLGYNTNRDIVMSAGLKMNRFKLMYTYGLVTNALGSVTTGNHEISLLLYFKRLQRTQPAGTSPEPGRSGRSPSFL